MNTISDPGLTVTLPDLLNSLATKFPDRPALAAPRRTGLNYSALASHIDCVQAALSEFGLGRGDRIALVLPNGPEMAAAFLGVAASAVCAPLNPQYRADEFDFYLSDLAVKALIVEAGSDSAALGVARSRGIDVIELASQNQAPAGIVSMHGRSRGAVDSTPAQGNDVALLLHTSGTTSRPKLVPLLHRNLCASAFNVGRTLRLSPDDCCLNVMPLFHIHGLVAALLSSLATGGNVVCAPDFSAPNFFEWMAEFRPTWYTAVPTMHQAALAHAGDYADVIADHRLRFIRSSSAALPASVMVALEALFKVPVIDAYGMTEAAHQMASNPLPPRARKPRSVGVAAGPEVAIMDVSGSQLAHGQPGEVVIRGANVMPGYENNAPANQASFSDGWFRTGDQGYLDADGYLFLTGRLKEVINRGGEKISPREVDEALLEHPAIAQAVAFALPHPTLGEDIAAAVVLKERNSVSAQEIREFLFERLPGFKIPSQVVIVPAIPKGPTGKLQRIGLADKLAEHMKKSDAAPRNEFERIVAEIFAEVLMIENFGIDANFFALGGDSLRATQVVTRVAVIFDIELPNVAVFRNPTTSELASEIAELVKTIDPIRAEVLARLLTPNGKVDRRALPAPQYGRAELGGTFVAPRDSIEELITEVWCEVLKLERVGVHDNFFDLGGHSLLAAQVVARLAKLLKVELPLRGFFETPTVSALAAEAEKRLGAGEAREGLPIAPAPRTGDLPLSFGQQRLWFLDRLEEKSTAYHMPMAMRLRGDLKRDALERAINAIVARHESLRTHFVVVEGEPAQVVAQALKIALPVEDLSALEEGARKAAIAAALQREREAPFNLNQGPLLRITLLKLGKREHILLRVCHHIVSDGWSTSVFNRELATLYEAFCEGRDNPLEPLAVQYPDYALWQRRWLQGEALERLLAYWTNKLEGAPPLLALPTDRPRTTNRSNRAESRTLDLPEELADALSAMCQRTRVTLFMALLAAFKVLLARYSGQEDIVIGSPIAVRNHVALEGLIGFFLNTIALRTDLSGNPTFEELLKRVRTTALEAYAHQDLPFEKLIEKINPQRNPSHTPVFQVLFNMHNFEEVPPSFAGLEVERLALPDPEAKFDLTLYAMKVGRRLRFRAVYSTDLFDGARIEQMLDQWQHLLTQVAENPNRPIHNYSLLTGETMRLLPNPAIALDEPFGVPVFRQFLAAAQVNAAQSAVRHEGRDWTYQQLEDTSKRIAKQLVACGVRSGEVVVVSGQRSFGLVASILGVLGARGIFLLIDPSLPSTRRDLMLQEARGAHWLHVGDGHDEDGNWSAAFRGLPTTRISSGGFCLDPSSEAAMEDVALVDAAPDEAAYIFFTSGTTGKPKAIVGSHKGLSHFIDWERQILGVVHNDRVAQLTGLSFDVVLRDIFLPLTSGATLCLPRPEIVLQGDQLVPWLRREGITILHAVPSLAHAWLDSLPSDTPVPTLRWVLFAGEPFTGQLILQWRKQIGGAGGMINLYGPTETTLAKCFHVLPTNPGVGIQPIGRPLPFTQALVLSRGGQLCGIGEPGEIVIRTPFRTLGYLNGSDSDRARFAPNPFRDDPSDLVYRTGDIGAYDNQGQLLISGRLDDQIKIRGSRVEPAEVYATLVQHPDVQQCAVVAREHDSGEKCLVAYVVQSPNCAFAEGMGLRDFLRRSLPDYMIPAAFVVLGKLPLTPNGKLDCEALPAPGNIRPHLAPDYVGPRNTAEETLVEVWRKLLKLDKIGVHDDFFELGGHSLIATRLASQIRNDFNIEIPLRAIFENPTIEELARRILEQ